MYATVVPSPDLLAAARTLLGDISGFTDIAWTVSLVEGAFDPTDPDTWPAASVHFDPLDSGSSHAVFFDAASGKWFMEGPEPAGGWTFSAETITDPITVTGFIVEAGTALVGAMSCQPINVTATGQVVTLPFVTLQVPEVVLLSPTPPLTL